jgi:hypothetical protein
MTRNWPEGIREFVALLQKYIATFKQKLVLVDQNHGQQPSATYEVVGGPWNTTVLIHQTQRSLETAQPEYRVRGSTKLPQQFLEFFQGRESAANRLAFLGCLVTNEKGVEVCWQALIHPAQIDCMAVLVANAAVHAAPAILKSIQSVVSGSDSNHSVSEWEQHDFEQLHYDYAHFAIGKLEPRRWSLAEPHGTLELLAADNNPYAGGGLLSIVNVRKDKLALDARKPFTINDLNLMTFLTDDAPMFGGWCDDEERLYFVTFVPNGIKYAVAAINEYVIEWGCRRLRTVFDIINLLAPSN